MARYTVGVDFGTESARAVLVAVDSGRVVATAAAPYAHGVIDRTLPGRSDRLPPDWALQHPQDWVQALQQVVREVVRGVQPAQVIGVGVDFTSCTVLPATADGVPLCLVPDFAADPHAWPKLWKHHAAQPYADRFNAAADHPDAAFLRFYGGKTSSEWLWAKGWQVLAESPAVASAMDRWIEGGDWIVWQLTGTEVRSACQAGYKAHWQKDAGYPRASFLSTLDPALPRLLDCLASPHPVGQRAGGLTAAWAQRLGLRPGTPVAVAVIDAHAGVPAVGVAEAGRLVAIMGTSTCHLLLDSRRHPIPGIAGVVEDGILPGFFGYEAGQASVGDIFQWFVRTAVPGRYGAEEAAFRALEEQAARLRAGEAGVLALDWWNGCRTPLVDADLSGLLVGLTVTTEPHEIYRALLEATAFGTRRVVETFEAGGVQIREVIACGGLAERNRLLLQLTADITGREVLASSVPHASAVGAAIYAAAAAGPEAGGYGDVRDAVAVMGATDRVPYRPRPAEQRTYDLLYREYLDLARHFGEGGSQVMKRLRRLRAGVSGEGVSEARTQERGSSLDARGGERA
jgi:L-ribulokinase